MSMPTLVLHDKKKTNTDNSLAMSDVIIKSKNLHWNLTCDQYTDMFEKPGKPMDHAITHCVDLTDKCT